MSDQMVGQGGMQGYRPMPSPYAAQFSPTNQFQAQLPQANPLAARPTGAAMPQPVPVAPWAQPGFAGGSIQQSVAQIQAQRAAALAAPRERREARQAMMQAAAENS